MGLDDIIGEYFPPAGAAAAATEKAPAKRLPARSARAVVARPVVVQSPADAATPIAETPAGKELQALLAPAPELRIVPPPRQELRLPVGLHLDVDHDDYIRDPAERPSLSSSVATTLATKAPLHGWFKHPRLGGGENGGPTPSQGRGSILHKLLLGKGQDVAVFDFPDFKKADARDARDAAIAEGKIPVVLSKFEEMKKTATVLIRRLADRGIILSGQSEVTGIWEKEGVLCRLRADHLIVTDAVDIIDIKTCTNAAPEKMVNDFVEYGDDVQDAAYTEGMGELIPEMVGRIRMRFIFCEAEAPNDVIVYEPPGDMRELGARRWRRGRDSWKRNLETYGEQEWPGYSITPIKPGPPAYVLTRDLEIAMNRLEIPNDKLPF